MTESDLDRFAAEVADEMRCRAANRPQAYVVAVRHQDRLVVLVPRRFASVTEALAEAHALRRLVTAELCIAEAGSARIVDRLARCTPADLRPDQAVREGE